MKPRILIAAGCSQTIDHILLAQVSYSYIHAVLTAGGAPFLMPPLEAGETQEAFETILDMADGVIITGGPDVPSSFYGKRPIPLTEEIKNIRGHHDLHLCRRALERDLPLLGICMGCQMLNVALGGSLIQDLLTQRPESTVVHRRRIFPFYVPHPVDVLPGTRLAEILGEGQILVPSAHHQAIEELGTGLRTSAVSTHDQVIEAIEIPGARFAFGIQWHPEKWAEKEPGPHRKLFESLVTEASRSTSKV